MKTPQIKPDWNTGIYIGNGVVAKPKFYVGGKAECHFTEDVVTIIADKGEKGFLIEYPDGCQQISHISCLVEIEGE